MSKKCYVSCDFKECPLKDNCGRYREFINRAKEDHFAVMPYKTESKKCGFYDPYDPDDINKIIEIVNPQ